jgi:peptide-methionine (S)-S-oxide reductase
MKTSKWMWVFGITLISSGVACTVAARERRAALPPVREGQAVALFAGGCFWCMETPFHSTPGVISATSGYTGGTKKDPTYHEVSSGGTGHAESVRVVFDPKRITYAQLLEVFWHNVDPFSAEGQFCDRGNQYRSAIFALDAEQKRLAEESKRALEKRFGRSIATEIVPANEFYAAEEYHQQFYKKNPARYYSYRAGCGRDQRLREVWGEAAGGH